MFLDTISIHVYHILRPGQLVQPQSKHRHDTYKEENSLIRDSRTCVCGYHLGHQSYTVPLSTCSEQIIKWGKFNTGSATGRKILYTYSAVERIGFAVICAHCPVDYRLISLHHKGRRLCQLRLTLFKFQSNKCEKISLQSISHVPSSIRWALGVRRATNFRRLASRQC